MNLGLWVSAEIAAMATDLAEFLGAALGFQLLFHWALLPSALVTGVIVFALLSIEKLGFRQFEYLIMAFVGAIGVAYAIEIFFAQPDWAQIAYHLAVPHLDGQSAYLAVGMLGATVMPHVIYLHSALVIIAWGLDPLQILILSQVALSFALPGAIIPLILLTRNKAVMGEHVNRRWTTRLAWVVAALIIALNGFLLVRVFQGG